MNAMVSNVIRFLVSEDGPTAVEYGVMLAIIIAVVAAGVQSLGSNASASFSSVTSSIS